MLSLLKAFWDGFKEGTIESWPDGLGNEPLSCGDLLAAIVLGIAVLAALEAWFGALAD